MLPKEVLQHIFSVGRPGWSPELGLEDRLRAMAVCSAWRDWLDPRKWPIDTLDLYGWEEEYKHLVPWVISVQPAVKTLCIAHEKTPQLLTTLLSVPRMVLESLSLDAASQTISDCLPAISVFPSLSQLKLGCQEEDSKLPPNFKALAPLTALEDLTVSRWDNICWEGGPLLPRITQLQLDSAERVALDAALPSLQHLRVEDVGILVIGGQHFQALQLSSLLLQNVLKELSVSWSQLGSLRELHARFMGEAVVSGTAELSAHTNLTALSLGWGGGEGAYDSACVLLQAAPRSLRSLSLEEWPDDRVPPPALAGLTQLTSLQCGSLAVIPHLSSLGHLQEVRFRFNSAADLSVHDLAYLSEVTGLRRLRFGLRLAEAGFRTRCFKVLHKHLPDGCEVEQA